MSDESILDSLHKTLDVMELAYTRSENLHKGSICGCGTKHDAFDVALKLFEQMYENDCLNWAMQVSSAMHSILMCVWAAKNRGIPENSTEAAMELAFFMNVMRAVRCEDPDYRKRIAAMMITAADDAVNIGIKDHGLDKCIGSLEDYLRLYPKEW